MSACEVQNYYRTYVNYRLLVMYINEVIACTYVHCCADFANDII